MPAGGNRHQLRLTPAGAQLVERWGSRLEERLAALVDASDVPYDTYLEYTRRLLGTLDSGQMGAALPRSPSAISPPRQRSL